MKVILGIDISKKWFDVVLCSLDGKFAEVHEQFANDRKGFAQLKKWLKQHLKGREALISACMEATGSHWKKLANWLYDQAVSVYVVNPARIKAYARSEQQRSKTDKIDAGVIARFFRAQEMQLFLWSPPRPELLELQSLVRTRVALVDIRAGIKCQLQSGIQAKVKKYLQAQVAQLDLSITELEEAIDLMLENDPIFKSLSESGRSVGKGVGTVTISTLISEYREFAEFHDGKQVVAYAGLDVSLNESGSSVRGKPRISKQGNAQVRRILYLAAEQAAHRNPAIKPLYDRLVGKGLKKKLQSLPALASSLNYCSA